MSDERYSRQTFLKNQTIINDCKIAIIGLGGGGSHILQQLGHIGFKNLVLYDPDIVEESNLNRLVGATLWDVYAKTPKVMIARRLMMGLHKENSIKTIKGRWQDCPEELKTSDIVIGCVDGFRQRRELEICARRYLIPYVDIGMDVHCVENQPPRMAGQVILSMPGEPCMSCLGFLNETDLGREELQYGDAGPRPQVIWPNGILASTAVGIVMDLVTDWSKALRRVIYFSYDGNNMTLTPHIRLGFSKNTECPHFPLNTIGEPTPIYL